MSSGTTLHTRHRLLLVWGACALMGFVSLDRGWIPHDEGTLAQSAERVMLGELPHRDFDEVYTGGLSALDAVAFRVLGVNLLTPRLVLYALFLLWVPVVFHVGSRLAGPIPTAVATLLAASWSLPVYPAAMPSWYNLFFATFGLAALFRHIDTDDRRWIFGAGLAGGCSILIKVSGLFFVAAGLLVLVYREQETSTAAPRREPDGGVWADRAYRLFVTACLAAFALLLVLLLRGRAGASGVVRFLLPLGSLALFLVVREWSATRAGAAARAARLAGLVVPFACGVLLPVAALVAVYAAAGATGDLWRGLFELPRRRFEQAAAAPPGADTLWVALPLLAVLSLDLLPRTGRQVAAAIVALGALSAVALDRVPYDLAWYLLNVLGPLVVIAGCVALAWKHRRGEDPLERQRALAALAVAGAVMLIQFPFSGAIYLFYALPAVALAGLVFAGGTEGVRRPAHLAVLVVLLGFTVARVDTGRLFAVAGFAYDPTAQTARLALPRGGNLRVTPEDKEEYERVVAALNEVSTSPYTLALPDLPEVYFLSGLRNPTRTLFDFFDAPDGRSERVLRSLDEHDVNVVVLNRRLRFSGPPPDELLEELRARYPRAALVGGLLVRWREDEP